MSARKSKRCTNAADDPFREIPTGEAGDVAPAPTSAWWFGDYRRRGSTSNPPLNPTVRNKSDILMLISQLHHLQFQHYVNSWSTIPNYHEQNHIGQSAMVGLNTDRVGARGNSHSLDNGTRFSKPVVVVVRVFSLDTTFPILR